MPLWAKLADVSRRFLISALEAKKMGVFMFFAPTPKNHENPHFVASRALVKNRLDTSSNLAHRYMHGKFLYFVNKSLGFRAIIIEIGTR